MKLIAYNDAIREPFKSLKILFVSWTGELRSIEKVSNSLLLTKLTSAGGNGTRLPKPLKPTDPISTPLKAFSWDDIASRGLNQIQCTDRFESGQVIFGYGLDISAYLQFIFNRILPTRGNREVWQTGRGANGR